MKLGMMAALLALGSCEQQAADDRICTSAPSVVAQGDMGACVHKWAYRLARSPGTTADIVKATVQACNDVARWQADKQTDIEAQGREYRQLIIYGEEQAHFRVIQARAGNCDIP